MQIAPLLAVDAPFLLYRSFYALPETIRGSEQRPVNALLGAANSILRTAAEHSPRAVAVCFGAEAAAYRVALYPAYHAARPPMPDALAWQFEQAGPFFERFGWSTLASGEVEADDLLGSLARVEARAGGRTLILTGDRDLFQCAGDRCAVLYLRAGRRGSELLGADGVRARYGVAPAQVPDFIALRGDPSDGLPGAPGIGARTAAALLARHGSLECAIAGAGQERPRVARILKEHAEQLRRFKQIAQLADVELQRPADAPTDLIEGARAARSLGMTRLAVALERSRSLSDL
jgi:5'-3' exonuclease